MLNNDLERSLLQEGLVARTMGTNKQCNFSRADVQHLGKKHLKERGRLQNRGSEKVGILVTGQLGVNSSLVLQLVCALNEKTEGFG